MYALLLGIAFYPLQLAAHMNGAGFDVTWLLPLTVSIITFF